MFVPRCGQNPTGSTLSLERRKRIYELSQKFDFIIVEDGKLLYAYAGVDVSLDLKASS